jgi:hypothetical protein
MTLRGSCHCGAIAFEVEGKIERALECNCSICQRKGSKLWFIPRSALKLKTPKDATRVYTLKQAPAQASLLPGVRHPSVRRGQGPEG